VSDVVLRVNGSEYAGWTSARVSRGIETAAGSFELSVSDRWAGSAPWPIREGDECTVVVAGEVMLTGYVDRRRVSIAAGEHSVSVSGRDRAGELVDCSAVLTTWEFVRTPVLEVARKVAAPHGVTVSLAPGLAPPPVPDKVSVDPGDSVFEVVERACRSANLLAASDGRGGLVLMRPDSTRTYTAIIEGVNLLSGSAEYDSSGRFRKVIVRGQSVGTDVLSGEQAAAVQVSAEDANVARAARVLLVRPEGAVTAGVAKRRAQWETAVRAARALSVTVSVQGWTQGNGTPWPINALVRVVSPRLELDEELLIVQATYTLDGSDGARTELQLRLPGAYEPEPVIPKKTRKKNPLEGL
jgi:prophage tail gpP-like protein